jgi:hypothetical protein
MRRASTKRSAAVDARCLTPRYRVFRLLGPSWKKYAPKGDPDLPVQDTSPHLVSSLLDHGAATMVNLVPAVLSPSPLFTDTYSDSDVIKKGLCT